MKKSVKKKLAEERQETFKTGGGDKKTIQFTPDEVMIIECLGQSARPLPNPADSDSKADDIVPINESARKMEKMSFNESNEQKVKVPMRITDSATDLIEMRSIEHKLKVELLQTKIQTAKLELEAAKLDLAKKRSQNSQNYSDVSFIPDIMSMQSQPF